MCCRHRDRGTCGTWSTRTWSSSACGAGFRRRWPGVSSGTCCTWHSRPHRGCCRWQRGTFGVVLSQALQTKEVGLLGPGFAAVEQRAGGGPQGTPKKRRWTAIRVGRDSGPRPRTLPEGNRGPAEQRAGGAPGTPRKSGFIPLFGGAENGASPAISASEFTKNRSSGM